MESLMVRTSEAAASPWLQAGPGLSGNCQVMIGTCGYSYTEWVDAGFYPPGTKTTEMLGMYSHRFSAVELNYTWYQMARADALERMVKRAPSHVFFGAKLTRTMTHERSDDWQQQVLRYREGIRPLGDRLLAVLIQLPPDFDRTIAHRRYLASLLDGLNGIPLAVEFRHRSWACDTVFAELERRKVSLVCVDAPALPGLFPCLDVVTNPDLVYVRFHGRNLTGWRSSNMQKKFLYDYSREELSAWYEEIFMPMAVQGRRALLFFNNHVRAYAPSNGSLLQEILEEQKGR